MKRILATATLALMLGAPITTGAFADAHSMKMETYKAEMKTDLYASNLIGMRIYSAEKDFDNMNADTMVDDGAEKEWDDIGEVNDVILGRDGTVKAVILGIGGFIGIGEKDVAVPMSAIKVVNEKDDADDFFLVVKTNKESLTAAEPFMRADDMDKMEDKAEVKTDEVKAEEVKTEDTMTDETKAEETKTEMASTETDPARPMLTRPTVEREGYVEAKMEDLTTEALTGARVYGSNDEDVGEIGNIILTDDGKIKDVIIDVGGFLGIGERHIAVSMDELNIQRQDGGDDFRVYIDATQEELEKQPEYNKS